MAITFPLSTAAFADKLKITAVEWKFVEQQEITGLGSGELLAVDLGPRLIEADVTTAEMYNEDTAELQALIETLDGAINAFYLYDPRKAYPRADPTGSILGASVPKIAALGGNNKSLSMNALPPGYKLSAGDLFAFDYGISPVRRALHRVVEAATAAGDGITPAFEVRTHFRPGVAAGIAIALIKPAAKVKMLPGSLSSQSVGPLTSRLSFKVRQTL